LFLCRVRLEHGILGVISRRLDEVAAFDVVEVFAKDRCGA
jgi:hypothetical protein